MEKTVWGDLLFFVNFCMDFQCLFLTAKVLRRPFTVWRGVLFSALGALYACAALFRQTSGVVAFLCDLGVCLLMCLGTFAVKKSPIHKILIPFAVYFGISAAVGGVMSAMAALLSHLSLPIGEGTQLSSWAFFLLAAVGGAFTLGWARFCRRRAGGRFAELSLKMAAREITVRGMVDTGNLLRDPVSGRPVVLLDASAAAALLPPAWLPVLLSGDTAALIACDCAARVRLIPGHTATGRKLLFALAPDAAFLDEGRGRVPVELLFTPVELAVDTGEYQALLPAELPAG